MILIVMPQDLKELLVGLDFTHLGLMQFDGSLLERHRKQHEIVTRAGALWYSSRAGSQ